MVWNINSYISLFTLIAYGALFFTVFMVKPHTKERRVFQVYLLMMFFWSLSAFFVFNSKENTLFWFRFMTVTGISSVIVIFFFLQVTLNQKFRWAPAAYIYGAGLVLISIFSNTIITSAEVQNGVIIDYEFSASMPFLVFPAFLLTFANFGLVWKAYRNTKSHQIRNRYLYIALGLLTISLGSIANFTPLGKYPVDIAANFIAALLFGYSILKHKLLDITIVLRKGLFYFVPTTIISATYFLIITLALDIFHFYSGFQIFLLSLLVAILTGLIIKPVQEKAQTQIDRLFFRDKYDFGQMLERLGKKTVSVLEINQLLDIIMFEISNTLHINQIAFIQRQETSGDFQMIQSLGIQEKTNLVFRANHPLILWLEAHQQCLSLNEMSIMTQFKSLWEKERVDIENLKAEIFIPVIVAGNLVGVFAAGKKQSDQSYTKEDERLLTTLANQTSVSIQNAWLYQKEKIHHQELNELYQLSQALLVSNQVKEIIDQTATHTLEIVHATFVRVLLMIEPKNQLVCKSAAQVRNLDENLRIGEHESPEVRSFYLNLLKENNLVTLTKDTLGMPIHIRKQIFLNQANSVLLAPINIDQQIFGILVVGEERSSYREQFNPEKISLINSIITQVSSALSRAKLHEEMEETFFETILALANAVDARDEYTSNHSSQISKLAIGVCDSLECDEGIRTAVYWASVLHDIGKIGIGDNILRKPGPLTDEEWKIMRTHPEIGADIVKPIKKMKDVGPLIRFHHERFDGGGYPQGLVGEDIPFGARIITVVDAFEAMTADRVYRKGKSVDEAIEELRRCSGRQFDPVIVSAFIESIENEQFVGINQFHIKK